MTVAAVSDVVTKDECGFWMGCVMGAGALGSTVMNVSCTALSGISVSGLSGWRVILLVLGITSLAVAGVGLAVVERQQRPWRLQELCISTDCATLVQYLGNPSIRVIFLFSSVWAVPIGVLTNFLPL